MDNFLKNLNNYTWDDIPDYYEDLDLDDLDDIDNDDIDLDDLDY